MTTTTTTTTTTTATQQGSAITVTPQSSTVTIGNYVTDVTLNPYIASRIIALYAYNMRPNQLLHVFFDSVLVDSYCAPCIVPTGSIDTSDYTSIQLNGTWGQPIYSDANGQVAAWFNIPAATFITGNHTVEFTDVNNLATGSSSITTLATGSFTASDLTVTTATQTLTTINPIINLIPVTNTQITTVTNTIVIPPVEPIPYQHGGGVGAAGPSEPIAQVFTINTPDNSTGVFATSLEIYFNQGSLTSNNGVTVYICDVDNGYPNGSSILPFSTTHLNANQITISLSSATSTKFTFESPVFLNNGQYYAFIVKPDNNDPDIQVFSANVGDVDFITGNQVYSQPTVGGTAFYGATTSEWTALQTEYLKFKLNIANFTSSIGTGVFNNTPMDFINIYNIAYQNSSVGILSGDYIFQSANSTPNTANVSITGIINYYDNFKNELYIDSSTGNFTSNNFIQIHRFTNNSVITPNTVTLIASANSGSILNPIVDTIVGQIASISPAGTQLNFSYKGTSNTYSIDSTYTPINIGSSNELHDKERIVASRTHEVSYLSGQSSLYLSANLATDSMYISPLIDTIRHQELVIQNVVSPVTDFPHMYNEYYNNGAMASKYISEIITLAQGQDSEDINVIVTGYRPPGTDIKAMVKFLNGSDPDQISTKAWTPLLNTANNFFSPSGSTSTFNEFVYGLNSSYQMLIANGTITVANSSANVIGTTSTFTTDLQPGYYISMAGNSTFTEASRQVISIANNTQLVLSAPFNGNYTNQPYYIVVPPTVGYLAANTQTMILDGALGNTALVSTSTTNNAIIGSNTIFTSLQTGEIISIGGDEQYITSISNNTYLTVGTPWTSNNTNVPGYIMTQPGLTYQNINGSVYNTYLSFQIKIILQSNDSSNVPLMHSVQALALLL